MLIHLNFDFLSYQILIVYVHFKGLMCHLFDNDHTSDCQIRRSKSKEDVLMDEIDDLYGYVRDGGKPPTKTKFQYDSDEESYWEEPAYEPLDKFRARLKALESGQQVLYVTMRAIKV